MCGLAGLSVSLQGLRGSFSTVRVSALRFQPEVQDTSSQLDAPMVMFASMPDASWTTIPLEL